MAQLTYLQLVNKVLKKLREDQVSTVSYNTYSALIGEFVNDAKKEVEDAWDWSVLLNTIQFRLTAGGDNDVNLSSGSTQVTNATYATDRTRLLRDSNNRPMLFMITTGKEMQGIEWFYNDVYTQRRLQPNQEIDDPIDFCVTTHSDGNLSVAFLYDPALTRDYQARFVIPQEDLASDNTVLSVPWRPVVNLALLYALDERGEEIGEPGSKAWLRYETSLADAVSLDALINSYKKDFIVP